MNTFLNFLENTPNAYLCAENIAKALEEKGFKRVYNKVDCDKFYIIKGDSSVIAMDIRGIKGFSIIAAHSDSPAFKLRPDFEQGEKLSVSPYGGLIYSSWFDRPLGIAGRITVKKENSYYSKAVDLKETMCLIPSLAIHMNRDINDGHKYNPQTELSPILTKSVKTALENILEEGEQLLSHDLYLYDRTVPLIAGKLLLSPRIDDLGCVYPALQAFLNTENSNNARVLAIFNSEEIGSATAEGADSTFLTDTLKAACEYKGVKYEDTLSSSFVVSADNGHAHHPNYPEKDEPNHKAYMGKGIMIKHHLNYSTNALSCALFKDIAKVPLQEYSCRNDLRCGSTLGNISLSHLSVNSIDIGIPMLAMHSACETCNTDDIEYMEKAMSNFYSAEIYEEKGILTVK